MADSLLWSEPSWLAKGDQNNWCLFKLCKYEVPTYTRWI